MSSFSVISILNLRVVGPAGADRRAWSLFLASAGLFTAYRRSVRLSSPRMRVSAESFREGGGSPVAACCRLFQVDLAGPRTSEVSLRGTDSFTDPWIWAV